MMTLIARWFEQTQASQDYQRSDYLFLWLVLAAGVVLRFWGLGNVGLHGDEETMAMPAMAILDTGHPYLPSGMYYARALLQIYMMSGSAWLFGESEWAFRLPSAIVGSLTGIAAFFMGRRFLPPRFNLAFVATIVFLPEMIELSQTARMYIFLVTGVIWFIACVFRWERNQRMSSLVLAMMVWILTLHFHSLAIFAAPLFFFPGLSRQSWKQLFQGAGAFVVGAALFKLYTAWIATKYPGESERPPPLPTDASQTPFDLFTSGHGGLALASFIIVAILAIALLVLYAKRVGWRQCLPPLAVAVGLLAMTALQYHIAGILILLGGVFWLRTPALSKRWLIWAVVLAFVITGMHLILLHNTGLYPGRKLIGALVGTPSVWPVLRFLQYSPIAGVVYGIALLFALACFARGQRLPIHFLFFAMAVWIPLLIIGFFKWYIPPRYAVGQLGPFLLCTFAGLAYLADSWRQRRSMASGPMIGVLAVLSLLMVKPLDLARTVDPDYGMYPDHKGAAEFIKNLNLPPSAILIAEDVLQQTYYLGKVDYWLREIGNSHQYSVVKNGRLVDFYTATPLIGSGEALEKVLDSSTEDVYIISNGESAVDGKHLFRGNGIAEVLEEGRLKVVYTGRDHKTKIWKLSGNLRGAAHGTDIQETAHL